MAILWFKKRRPKIPFYARILAFAGVIAGLFWSEKLAPVLTARIGWKTFIDLGYRIYQKFSSS